MKRHPLHKAVAYGPVYTLLDEIQAHPSQPTDAAKVTADLTKMWASLAEIESGTAPTIQDWRACSHVVNMLETLTRDMGIAEDANGLLDDAVAALATAGNRWRTLKTIRLDGPGIHAVRAVLEDYAALLEILPARTVIRAHRRTESRVQRLLQGRGRQSHDKVIRS